MLPYRHTPDMEEQDRDDLEAFEQEIAIGGGTKLKGKEKEGTTTPPHKSRPIPNDAKEEASALQATFHNSIEALAARIGKSPDRYTERWEDPMERAKLLQPMVKWYKEQYNDFIDKKKVDGTFHKIIAKTRDEFMHLVQLASQYHNLHCFRFIMNLHPDEMGHTGSMMWGVTHAYELMKKKQKKIISEEMAEWESLLRVSDIELCRSTAVDNLSLMFMAKLKKHTNIHNNKWSLFIEWLQLDI
ncbi:hypothetical protein DXG01_009496, partial [Tephrocybe rancida]